jgi:3-phenylpropionate/cinnamic acid dioxygenase small subunit
MTVADAALSARAAQFLYTYARAVDEGDLDTLAAMAADDVQITRVDGTHQGRDAFLAVYRAFRDSPVLASLHVITNVQAFPEEDGLVRVRAYFEATMFDADGSRKVLGQYADTVRDTGDALVYVHKRIAVERVVNLPVASAQWQGVAVGSPGGAGPGAD